MIRRKYFLLTAILLVGVVLLSGCLGGGSDLVGDGDSDTEEVINNTEAQATFEAAVSELGNQNKEKAKNYFIDDFIFKAYEYDWYENNLTNFIDYYGQSEFDEEIKSFEEITNNHYFVNMDLSYPTKYWGLKFKVKFKEVKNEYYIEEIKDISAESENLFIKEIVKTLETSTEKEKFINAFTNDATIKDKYNDKTYNNPGNLYDFYKSEIDTADFKFGQYFHGEKRTIEIYGDVKFNYTDGSSLTREVKVIINRSDTNNLKIISLTIYY